VQIEQRWRGLITWHPDVGGSGSGFGLGVDGETMPVAAGRPQAISAVAGLSQTTEPPPASQRGRAGAGPTAKVGYVNRNQQEVVLPTGKPGTDHGQYVYVLRCRTCGHHYGANGSDIWLRRCPAHDCGAPGLAI